MSVEPIIGRYLTVTIAGTPRRIYFEETGQGRPVLCLHTAGADTRQWRHLMNDAGVTANHRLIAFDMPWHGKSLPPEEFETQEYLLTTEAYIETVLAVIDGLGLDRPILAGCSMGGASRCNWRRCMVISSAASLPSKRRISSPPGMTSTGSTALMRMVERWARPWFPPISRPMRRNQNAGTPCGCSCKAGRACSGATSASIPAMIV